MADHQPSPERIFQLATGAWAASILGAAATHSVFTHLDAGGTTAKALAERAGISERGAQCLLDGLVGLGLIDVTDGTYRNTPESAEFLVEGKPSYLGAFAKLQGGSDMARHAELAEVVVTGIPVTTQANDAPDNPFWESLVPAIAPLSVPSALMAAERLGLAGAGPISILDVGGGSGIYSAVWLEMNPQARSTQLDWPTVNRIATRFVAQHGVADRFQTIDGDFHTVDFGEAQYDIGIYSHIAHQEGRDDNVAVFRKFRRALKPAGTLVINDFVVRNDRSGPPFPLIFHSEMLLMSKNGATWREDDYRAWLIEAGYRDITFLPTPSPATLVLAR
jgi:SAM-dependent methyltransferase